MFCFILLKDNSKWRKPWTWVLWRYILGGIKESWIRGGNPFQFLQSSGETNRYFYFPSVLEILNVKNAD